MHEIDGKREPSFLEQVEVRLLYLRMLLRASFLAVPGELAQYH